MPKKRYTEQLPDGTFLVLDTEKKCVTRKGTPSEMTILQLHAAWIRLLEQVDDDALVDQIQEVRIVPEEEQ